jgi:hypothetical protein
MNVNLFPAFVTAVPEEGFHGQFPDQWTMMVGFEGIAKVVEHQIEKCSDLLKEQKLKIQASGDYPLLDGCFKEIYDKMSHAPYLLKAAVYTAKMANLIDDIKSQATLSTWLIDFGCGRIFGALDALEGGAWAAVCRGAQFYGGHVQLDKAPDTFRQKQDVFGAEPRMDWSVMHNIKKALDPQALFAPGRLPGKV